MVAQLVKNRLQCGDPGLIPGLGRSPREGKVYPLQYSGLENPTEYIVHGVTKGRTQLSDFHFHLQAVTVLLLASQCGFLLLFCLITVARTSNTVLNKNGKSRHSCLSFYLSERFSPLSVMLAVSMSYIEC